MTERENDIDAACHTAVSEIPHAHPYDILDCVYGMVPDMTDGECTYAAGRIGQYR